MDNKIKILLVEDDAMVVRMYEKKFDLENFALFTAFNGQEGIEMLKKNSPDIVLLDIMMPKMNGLEMLKIMKADPKFKDIPVVILTNLGDRQDDIKKCKELGALDYWVKANMSLNDLARRIKKIINKY